MDKWLPELYRYHFLLTIYYDKMIVYNKRKTSIFWYEIQTCLNVLQIL